MVNILTIVSNYSYDEKVYIIIKDAEKTSNRILYVSLNKTYKSLLEQFRTDNIDLSKFFFIDTITATVVEPKPVENCLFVSSLNDLNDLYKGIIRIVKEKDIEVVIFDSLSSLMTYQDFSHINNFITTLLGSLSMLQCSLIMTVLKSDEETKMVQHIKMKVDKCYEES